MSTICIDGLIPTSQKRNLMNRTCSCPMLESFLSNNISTIPNRSHSFFLNQLTKNTLWISFNILLYSKVRCWHSKPYFVIMDVKHEIPWPKNCLRLSVYDGIPSKLAPNDVQSRLTAWSMRSMPSHNVFKWFMKSKFSYRQSSFSTVFWAREKPC